MFNESALNNLESLSSFAFNNNQESNKQMEKNKLMLLISLATLTLATLAWFTPTISEMMYFLDKEIYWSLNGSLSLSRAWARFWAYLNHPAETWINLLVMLGVNITAILSLDKSKRLKASLYSLYFWIFFQILLLLTHFVFSDILNIKRNSPTITVEPIVFLSQMFNIDAVKEYSNSCFPAGHTLVAIFWFNFMWMQFKNKFLRTAFLTVALLLCVARMFTGAHWASDVIFTALYATSWFFIAKIALEKLERSKIVMIAKMAFMFRKLRSL